MSFLFEYIIKIPIGYILGWIYQVIPNYGWALIVFTLVIRLLLMPLGLKQQKSMTKMQKLQPKLKDLQEKYKNDQNMLSKETMKLYKEYGVSPMGGCLPLLLQMPILFGLYRVIYRPLTYMSHMSNSKIWDYACQFGINTSKSNSMAQIEIAEKSGAINFDFFGLNLAMTPKAVGILSFAILIPVLAGVTTYFASKITTLLNKDKQSEKKDEAKPAERILSPEQKKASGAAANTEGMTKSMMYIMPLFTIYITYTLPSALGLYWIASNIFSIGQTFILNGYFSNKLGDEISEHEKEKAAIRAEKYRNKKRKGNK